MKFTIQVSKNNKWFVRVSTEEGDHITNTAVFGATQHFASFLLGGKRYLAISPRYSYTANSTALFNGTVYELGDAQMTDVSRI